MRAAKPASLFAVLTVGFLIIYLAVAHAQDRAASPYPPPAVLPKDLPPSAPPKKKDAKKADPKQPDPTLIVPPAVYEEPRPLKGNGPAPQEIAPPPPIVQTGGVQLPDVPPPPGMELPKLPIDAEGPAKKPIDLPPPLPVPPAEPKMDLPPLPIPAPASKHGPSPEPLGQQLPVAIPGLNLDPPTKPSAEPPKAVVAPAGPSLPPPPVADSVPVPQPTPTQAPAAEKPRGFVRIQSEPGGPIGLKVPQIPPPAPLTPPLTEMPAVVPLALPPPAAPGEPLASSAQSPAVSVEKRGPATAAAGTTVTYQYWIRNQGNVAAGQIRVEDDLPSGARLLTAEPTPILQNGKVVWTLPALGPQKDQQLRLTLQAGTPIQGPHRTSVQVTGSSQATTMQSNNAPPAANTLGVELIAPTHLAIGKSTQFQIRVVNHSDRPVTDVALHATLPQGLANPAGRVIRADVKCTLQPGESKTLAMPARAIEVGRFTVQTRVTTATGQEGSATATIEIAADSLLAKQEPGARLLVGRDGELHIEISNPTGRAMRNVTISSRLPANIDFVSASDRGLYQANTRTVHWLLDNLPADQSRTLRLRLYALKPGAYENVIVAKADGEAPVHATSAFTADALADLSLHVVAKDGLLEFGRETTFEIHVQNSGNAPASNVSLRAQFPPGLIPRKLDGANVTALENHVVAHKIALLQPQEKVVLRLTAAAQQAGDQRVRFAIVSDQTPTPIQRETSTRVYRD